MRGGYKTTAIMNYFIQEIMSKTVLWHCKWSIEDVFDCKDLLARFVAQTYTNDKVFPPDKPLIKNVETALRIGGKGVAEKPANFPLKTVDYILNKYNVNNWWYDYSCNCCKASCKKDWKSRAICYFKPLCSSSWLHPILLKTC